MENNHPVVVGSKITGAVEKDIIESVVYFPTMEQEPSGSYVPCICGCSAAAEIHCKTCQHQESCHNLKKEREKALAQALVDVLAEEEAAIIDDLKRQVKAGVIMPQIYVPLQISSVSFDKGKKP